MSLLEQAESIGKEIAAIAIQINKEHWVKTGRHLNADDYLPEIVASVIYIMQKTKVGEK